MAHNGDLPPNPGRLRTWFHDARFLLGFAWKHRSFLRFLVRAARRKREIQKVDLRAEDGLARKPPGDVNLYLTHACNLACKMCPYYGEEGIFRDRRVEKGEDPHLGLDVYARIAAELGNIPTFYYLSGGEPLLYRPGVGNLVRQLKKHPATVALNTNGTLLAEQAGDLVEAGLDLLILSLDGPEEVHDLIRGSKGSFARAVEGLERVRAFRRESGRATPVLSVLFTVSRWNHDVLDRLPALCTELGVDMAGINFLFFTDPKRGEDSRAIWRRAFGVDAEAWRGFLIDVEGIDTSVLSDQYASVLAARKDFLFYTMPPGLRPDQIRSYYHDLDETFGRTQCWKAWFRTYIQPNGDMSTCEDFSEVVTGNVLSDPLLDIWNGAKYRRFRRVIRERGHFPFCTRCTNGLYET